ncbi:MAG: hypothetical protein GYB55_01855 [Cytophagales bacterium]|uniref:hypothetical protein n=1 Tax=Cyclobacterium marinum TaxID=104 RepID=UPI0030DDABE6|nr:hypothetical protein [Cytophagales bacterium]
MVIPKITETLVNASNFINFSAKNPVTPVRTAKNKSMVYIKVCTHGPGYTSSINQIIAKSNNEKNTKPNNGFLNKAFI